MSFPVFKFFHYFIRGELNLSRTCTAWDRLEMILFNYVISQLQELNEVETSLSEETMWLLTFKDSLGIGWHLLQVPILLSEERV